MTDRQQQLRTAVAWGAEGFLRTVAGTAGRMAVFVWLSTVSFLVLYLLSETLPAAEAAELEAAIRFSVAGVEVSIFGVFVTVTTLWVISPFFLHAIEAYEEVRES